jgi:hypothetical protein
MVMHKRIIPYAILLLLFTILTCFTLPVEYSSAQSETSYDLINQVNNLRASLGMNPYQIDAWLMSYAQEHTEYQASIQRGTHQHSDGTFPWEIGLQENVASGDGITVYDVVYNIWVDEGHRKTMVGYPGGWIGAGIALAENGQVYYTIDVRPAGDSETITPIPSTAIPFVPLITNTPQQDGTIIHVVQPGETLWHIAISYGVSVDVIRSLNGLAADSTIIYIGQKLLIRPANVTPQTSPSETSTVSPAVLPGETSTVFLQITLSPTSLSTATPIATLTYPITSLSSFTSTITPTNPVTALSGSLFKSQGILLLMAISSLLAAGIFLYWISGKQRQSG